MIKNSLFKPKDPNKSPPNALNPFFWPSLVPSTIYITAFVLVSAFSLLYAPDILNQKQTALVQVSMLFVLIHLMLCCGEFNKYWSSNSNEKIATTDFSDYSDLAKDLIREREFLSSWDYWKLNYLIQEHKADIKKGANQLDESLESRLEELHPTLFN